MTFEELVASLRSQLNSLPALRVMNATERMSWVSDIEDAVHQHLSHEGVYIDFHED